MIKAVFGTVLLVMLTLSGSVLAEGRVPFPEIPKGQGDKCVLDTAYMRINHMKVILHHRNDTVRQGIRTKRFSLKGCIECHAVPGPNKQPVSVKSPKHFCRACHDYAAVKVDCFQCHASTPSPPLASEASLK